MLPRNAAAALDAARPTTARHLECKVDVDRLPLVVRPQLTFNRVRYAAASLANPAECNYRKEERPELVESGRSLACDANGSHAKKEPPDREQHRRGYIDRERHMVAPLPYQRSVETEGRKGGEAPEHAGRQEQAPVLDRTTPRHEGCYDEAHQKAAEHINGQGPKGVVRSPQRKRGAIDPVAKRRADGSSDGDKYVAHRLLITFSTPLTNVRNWSPAARPLSGFAFWLRTAATGGFATVRFQAPSYRKQTFTDATVSGCFASGLRTSIGEVRRNEPFVQLR